MTAQPLQAERLYVAHLLEAVQRCSFHMHASARKLRWPQDGMCLHAQRKNADLSVAMAVPNERFAKLQDTLGPAMRNTALLMGEATPPFLPVVFAVSDDFGAGFQHFLNETGVSP